MLCASWSPIQVLTWTQGMCKGGVWRIWQGGFNNNSLKPFVFCCRDLGFGEGERIVNEARRRRRGEAGVQLQTNKQPAAPECPVCLLNLVHVRLNKVDLLDVTLVCEDGLISCDMLTNTFPRTSRLDLDFLYLLLFNLWHRSVLMRWCLPQRYSSVLMDTSSARLASESL